MDEIDALVARVRADGPVPLPLNGWDQASIWGWDETANSLFAELWRNPDDPAKPPRDGSGQTTSHLPSHAWRHSPSTSQWPWTATHGMPPQLLSIRTKKTGTTRETTLSPVEVAPP